jgi:heme-degrading monooxygenase HmoA
VVTVGMNYEVLRGREHAFESVFARVLEIMKTLPGHADTHLYREVGNPSMYLIVSRWRDRAAFEAFLASEQFRKVADWGRSQILAGRPRHEVYGDPAEPGA